MPTVVMLPNDLVVASTAVAEDSSRLAKIGHLSALLPKLARQEVNIAVTRKGERF